MNNPYNSHFEVLKVLGNLKYYEIQSVIEFGAGEYSTKHFLNKDIFPKLEVLISFESDSKYCDIIDVKRHFPILCSDTNAIRNLRIMPQVDLIFVDGKYEASRVPTAMAAKEYSPLIVVHDMENTNYHSLLKPEFMPFQVVYNTETPHTGIFCAENFIWEEICERLKVPEDLKCTKRQS